MTDPRIEAAIDAVLQARRWRDRTWGDGAIGGFNYSTDEKKRYVIRDHEAEEREGKTVVLHETDDRKVHEREFERACLRREIVAVLQAADVAAWRPIESAPRDGTNILASWQRNDGKTFVVRVYWDAEFSGETNEETGLYEWKGAWTDDSVASWGMEERHSYECTHWMPLPAPPAETSYD
ncbi:hypothetical protein AA103196_1001 [Ameyamaea chiangmaiensis NBRC 103196]|uniref:DUF551 domain-containing protein n=1 Tax=Ameyamaea chiangmaiensis TaxID=442969 RepID=A0A850PBR4_9PROT|nr:DUF551 domain-containing protein [Ameyamaea chiangmaiensis]MBS4074627.1 DUF551 domain-containing protein [Ameyamaea chiangmaiensis]NVN39382.1 DUF551 domain-containing protein [Ameyamaea chiangmaiensis]GBQ64900.1 hypothetical protein AA103196_1001 [Ameyamaea chiangmaiensis NBRC 103196]